MEMIAAVCHGPRDVALAPTPVGPLQPDEVLVKVAYCGVCPWDLRAYLGLSSARYPLRLGHEVSGVVADLGSGANGLRAGERVVVDVIRRCGRCAACRRGLENHCANADYSRGGYAEYIVALRQNVHPLRAGTPLIAAALTEPLACAVRGQRLIGIRAGETVLLAGSGPLGLLHLQALKSAGARVIVSDYLEPRLEKARSLGADLTVNPAGEDLAQTIAAATDGFGVDAAIIAASQVEAVQQALPLLAFGARLLLFAGLYPDATLPVDLNQLHYREISVSGSSDYTSAEFTQALSLIEDGAVQIAPLISDVYPLSDVAQAIAAISSRTGLKVVVRCNDLEPWQPDGRG